MARIPNYKIDAKLEKFESFENYNNTISGYRSGSRYSVIHWNTRILDYDVDTQKIEEIALGFISQTTSTLVGRILRALPKEVVLELIRSIPDRKQQRRVMQMARMF
jgi:hypothetical protein